MKVRKARKLLSRVTPVQILKDNGEIAGTYQTIESVPSKYDDWKVKGIGAIDPICGEMIDNVEHSESFDKLTFPCLELYIGKK